VDDMATQTLKKILVLAFSAGGLACFHPEPLDTGAMMSDLRRSQSAPVAAGGAAPQVGNEPLAESRGVALALAGNRDLRALRLARGVAVGESVTAAELANPTLRFEVTHLQEASFGQLGWDTRLAWEPPQPGVRAGRRGAAQARIQEFDSELSEKEWDLACDVRSKHATIVAVDAEIQIAQDTLKNRQKLGDLVTRRAAQGAATRFEIDLAKLSLVSAARTLDERRLSRTMAVHDLFRLLGATPPVTSFQVAGTLTEEAPDAPVLTAEALEDQAMQSRPLLSAAKARYEAAQETLRAEEAARWPWIRLSAAPRIRRKELTGSLTDFGVGLDVTVPILNFNGGRIQSASAARDAARGQVASALESIRVDIAKALADVAAQRAMLVRLHGEIEPILADHDRLLAAAAQVAELDVRAFLAAEDMALASRTQLIDAKLQLKKAHIALERVVGTHVGTGAMGGMETRTP